MTLIPCLIIFAVMGLVSYAVWSEYPTAGPLVAAFAAILAVLWFLGWVWPGTEQSASSCPDSEIDAAGGMLMLFGVVLWAIALIVGLQ